MITDAKFITADTEQLYNASDVFVKKFQAADVQSATLYISAHGVYEAYLNGKRIGDFILAPGWTSYQNRIQYQTYDVTGLLQRQNVLEIHIAVGWMSDMGFRKTTVGKRPSVIASLEITDTQNNFTQIVTDTTWQVYTSPISFVGIYDGERYDARVTPAPTGRCAVVGKLPLSLLVKQQGEKVIEHESYPVVDIIRTPKGEMVLDFGYNLVGYVEMTLPDGKSGDIISYTHAEILDTDGNFYTANLRSAKQRITYIAKDGAQTYKPHFTFQGGRYVRLDRYPYPVKKENFRFIVVHSDIKRTGYFECSEPLVNTLYDNIIRGQRGNFLDVPTDCPQRDERLGWTGDAQVFIRTAAYNFDVEKFFDKWLTDLTLDQRGDGSVPSIIPAVGDLTSEYHSAAWQDAACICPWQIYLAYGNKKRLDRQFESMRRYVDFIDRRGGDKYMWNAPFKHYGDWLAMDVEGSRTGGTSHPYIAQCFFAYSTCLLIKAGEILGKDMSYYRELYQNVVRRFRKEYLADGLPVFRTQTACVLALHFELCEAEDREKIADLLCTLIHEHGDTLTTGFVGTPYLLHALTETGHTDLAYTLLLQQKYPSWLYSVKMGATTVWEHWDGINEKGELWSPSMNSYNHYAYGSVADWMYGVAAGICPDETAPGYRNIMLCPHPDRRLQYVKASLDTRYGTVRSEWHYEKDTVCYHFVVPDGATADITVGDQTYHVPAGAYDYRI